MEKYILTNIIISENKVGVGLILLLPLVSDNEDLNQSINWRATEPAVEPPGQLLNHRASCRAIGPTVEPLGQLSSHRASWRAIGLLHSPTLLRQRTCVPGYNRDKAFTLHLTWVSGERASGQSVHISSASSQSACTNQSHLSHAISTMSTDPTRISHGVTSIIIMSPYVVKFRPKTSWLETLI